MKKTPNGTKQPHNSGFQIIMAAALLFLTVFMVVNAVSQFRSGQTVSGCVSVLGSILFLGLGILMGLDLIKELRSRKHSQEDSHE